MKEIGLCANIFLKCSNNKHSKGYHFKALSVATLCGVSLLSNSNSTLAMDVNVNDSTSLSQLNQLKTNEERNFNFNNANETYTVTENLGQSTEGTININGVASDSAKSVIDFDGHSGFQINSNTNLNAQNVVFKNAHGTTDSGPVVNITGGSGIINFKNVDFIDNTLTSNKELYGGAISNRKGHIEEISGSFVNNKTISNTENNVYGGSIFNENGKIDTINAKFESNYMESKDVTAGSAILNSTGSSTIGTIRGDFINNTVKAGTSVSGGVITNHGTITDINGNFTGNTSNSLDTTNGGVIYNKNKVNGVISGTFSNNTTNVGTTLNGGVLANSMNAYIHSIKADFINNKTFSNGYEYGLILYNKGTIDTIEANFIKNVGKSTEDYLVGILTNSSDAVIDSIKGNFIGNELDASTYIQGGSLYNHGTITNIESDFIQNISNANTAINGGSFSNYGTITSIEGDFIKNEATAGSYIQGGVLYNNGKIESLKSNFTGNNGESKSYTYGGVLYNNGKIGSLKSNFTENSGEAKSFASGGAIYNTGEINNIEGDFIKNATTADSYVRGGGIYNNKTITSIEGNFIKNDATAGTYILGGVLYNNGKIESLKSNFTGNSGEAKSYAYGGAIYNTGEINGIEGDFKQNITNANTVIRGGGIYNAGTITSIEGNFIKNEATADTYIQGGGLYNNKTIESIEGDFIQNISNANTLIQGGTLYNYGKIENIEGDFIENAATAASSYIQGGALHNTGTITSIEGDFKQNITNANTVIQGGALHNTGTITSIEGDFKQNITNANTVIQGGVLCNKGKIESLKSNFTANSGEAKSYAYGGAIYNTKEISGIEGDFLNNSVKTSSEDKLALGGAVFSDNANMKFVSENRTTLFDGNTTEDYRGKLDNAIFVRTNTISNDTESFSNPTITMSATNNGKFILNDTIDGGSINNEHTTVTREHQYNLNFTGDESGKVEINNSIYNANISHDYVTTNVNAYEYLSDNHNSLVMNSGNLNIGNLTLQPVNFEHFEIHGGNINIQKVQVDLENKVMGRIVAKDYGASTGGNVNVQSMMLLNDGKENVTPVAFADTSFKETVKSDIKEAYAPIYRYDVSYDTTGKYGEDGHFVFTRGGCGGSGGNASSVFNPAVLSTPVSSIAATQATINESFKYVFEHADAFTQMPHIERYAKMNSNKYALNSTDYNYNLGSLRYDQNNKAGWFRPYATFEKMNLKHGPKVDAITYGSLVGFDTDFQEHKNGWYSVGTGYIGYNGSQLSYRGVDTTTNGGLLGYTHTRYKGNFWTALTLSAGASVGESKTMYGKEDFTSLMAGVGSKTGYNFEFKEGKYILQPIMFMSYTFANTFDYTNAAGVKIKPSPAHSIQLNPSVRFIANTKNGWQPYASVGMVWNVFNENKVTANAVRLPEMGMKPYAEYGLGIQRNWEDKFTAFGQAMVRNGGRNGIALTLGFRWALGRDKEEQKQHQHFYKQKDNLEKVNLPKSNNIAQAPAKTVIKQMSTVQRAALCNDKKTNTTITQRDAVLKQILTSSANS